MTELAGEGLFSHREALLGQRDSNAVTHEKFRRRARILQRLEIGAAIAPLAAAAAIALPSAIEEHDPGKIEKPAMVGWIVAMLSIGVTDLIKNRQVAKARRVAADTASICEELSVPMDPWVVKGYREWREYQAARNNLNANRYF